MAARLGLGLLVLFASFVFFANFAFANLHPGVVKMCLADYETSHDFEPLKEKVTREHKKKVSRVLKEAKCDQPKPILVPIKPRDSNYKYVPDHVLVNRCRGTCNTYKNCHATASKTTHFPVSLLDGPKTIPKAGMVSVEEHTQCGCSCTVKEIDCNERQEYKSGECKCRCLNDMDMEKNMCLSKLNRGFEWNMDKCECECTKDTTCNTGTTWAPAMCMCIKVGNGDSGLENNQIT